MKQIRSVIRHEKFPAVDAALKKVGVGGLTVSEAMGRGRSSVTVKVHARGDWTYTEEYVKHLIVTIIVRDDDVDKVVKAILDNASTKTIGDGKIFIMPIERAIDIASGESNTDAVLEVK